MFRRLKKVLKASNCMHSMLGEPRAGANTIRQILLKFAWQLYFRPEYIHEQNKINSCLVQTFKIFPKVVVFFWKPVMWVPSWEILSKLGFKVQTNYRITPQMSVLTWERWKSVQWLRLCGLKKNKWMFHCPFLSKAAQFQYQPLNRFKGILWLLSRIFFFFT